MGAAASLFDEFFPPKSTYKVSDIPDLSGKVMIVTGGNAGVGKETVKALLQHNAKVHIAARSADKALQTIADLKLQTEKEANFLKLDLGDLKSIKAAAEEFLSKEVKVDVLFNNAGVWSPPIDELTAQGYDLQFGTNVLGHFYFTKLLVPALLAAARASPDGKSRVINLSSSASMSASTVDFNTFKDSPARKKLGSQGLYSQSKLGNVLFSTELATRYGGEGIVSTSLNPGNLNTDLLRHFSPLARLAFKLVLYPVEYGALTPLWAGTSEEGRDFNGKYLIPWARVGQGNSKGQDPTVAKELWNWCEEQVANV